MEFRAVVSSNINGIAYDEASSTLYVDFKGGSRYKYDKVPQEVYEDFLLAASPGSYFHENVKNVYPTTRV